MDPNETLRQLRVKVTQAQEDNCMSLREAYDIAMEVSDLFQALDNWISRRGFLPNDWNWK